MFQEVIIDFGDYSKLGVEDCDIREVRLYPFLYLIADKVREAGLRDRKYQNRPEFVESARLMHEGRPNIIDHAKNDEGILFTPNLNFKAGLLRSQSLSAKNAVLLLAAAGLEITVPNLTIDIARSEEIVEIREKLVEEKANYLISVTGMADETFDRLASGFYQDTVDWALNEALFKISPKALEYEIAIKKLDRNLLQRVGINFFKDGVPAIGSTIIDKGLKEGAKKSISVLLEVLCKNLALQMEERKYPEAVYGIKVSKELSKFNPLTTQSSGRGKPRH